MSPVPGRGQEPIFSLEQVEAVRHVVAAVRAADERIAHLGLDLVGRVPVGRVALIDRGGLTGDPDAAVAGDDAAVIVAPGDGGVDGAVVGGLVGHEVRGDTLEGGIAVELELFVSVAVVVAEDLAAVVVVAIAVFVDPVSDLDGTGIAEGRVQVAGVPVGVVAVARELPVGVVAVVLRAVVRDEPVVVPVTVVDRAVAVIVDASRSPTTVVEAVQGDAVPAATAGVATARGIGFGLVRRRRAAGIGTEVREPVAVVVDGVGAVRRGGITVVVGHAAVGVDGHVDDHRGAAAVGAAVAAVDAVVEVVLAVDVGVADATCLDGVGGGVVTGAVGGLAGVVARTRRGLVVAGAGAIREGGAALVAHREGVAAGREEQDEGEDVLHGRDLHLGGEDVEQVAEQIAEDRDTHGSVPWAVERSRHSPRTLTSPEGPVPDCPSNRKRSRWLAHIASD